MTAASTLHSSCSPQHLVAQAGVFHVERDHLAQPEAQHREGFSGLAGRESKSSTKTRTTVSGRPA
jgi:hypothetical protein